MPLATSRSSRAIQWTVKILFAELSEQGPTKKNRKVFLAHTKKLKKKKVYKKENTKKKVMITSFLIVSWIIFVFSRQDRDGKEKLHEYYFFCFFVYV